MKQFFGNSGLTTTSASYYANLAQEQIKFNEAFLKGLNFVNEKKLLLSSGKSYPTRKSNVLELNQIGEVLKQNATLYYFIAYIKEAIKAKEQTVHDLPKFEVWLEGKIEERPDEPDYVTEESVMSEWPIEKLTKYLRLQQFAAVYGKAIHRDGSVTNARNRAHYVTQNPNELQTLDNDVIVTEIESAFPIADVDNMYNELQVQRREYDKQLNAIKYELLEEINKRNNEAQAEYRAKLADWRLRKQELVSEYNTDIQNKTEEIQTTWKIVIPVELQDIFKYLQSLGKKADK